MSAEYSVARIRKAAKETFTIEQERMLTAYADTLSKPADSGMEAEREFFARDFYEEAREGKKAWSGQCDSGRAVTDEMCRQALRKLPLCAAGTPLDMMRAALEAALAAQGQGEKAAPSHRRLKDALFACVAEGLDQAVYGGVAYKGGGAKIVFSIERTAPASPESDGGAE